MSIWDGKVDNATLWDCTDIEILREWAVTLNVQVARLSLKKTLRDEFAMAAMKNVQLRGEVADWKTFADCCYFIADAMLKAR